MRLFVALHLEPETRAALAEFQAAGRAADRGAQVRWVDSESAHLTLAFLGEVADDRRPAVVEAVADAVSGRGAPRLGLWDAGAFPNLRRPRVLWVGLREEGDALSGLQQAVAAALAPLGWQPERRAFQPHLTVGRVRETAAREPVPLADGLRAWLVQAAPRDRSVRTLERVALVRSHLGAAGARYEDLAAWRLRDLGG